ncbi:hypothetical protein SBA6_930002 [Candidatus Sulfopaludibacter sp. SbA6]|nr:hypothetical protein SBA6_930002 [Candidatus Sulfopaludibacter sp. SbA6]
MAWHLMPKIETWGNLPPSARQHLIDRMRDRAIGIADLNHFRLWIDSNPEGRKAVGIRTSVRSRSAATDHCRKRFCWVVKQPKGGPSRF